MDIDIEEDDNFDFDLFFLDDMGHNRRRKNKKLIICIIPTFTALLIVIGVILFLTLRDKNEDTDEIKKEQDEYQREEEEFDDDKQDLEILFKDPEIKKPKIKFNASFEIIKLKNGMVGLLVNDPFAKYSHVHFHILHGFSIDTVEGLSHLGEHMILQSNEKYRSLYPPLEKLMILKDAFINAQTNLYWQEYICTMPFNFHYENAIEIFSESFKHPLYEPNIIEKEIQAVNSEFYLRINKTLIKTLYIAAKYMSNETSFYNNNPCGNNKTLKPSKSIELSKKLKGYHKLIKNPKNIFFSLYSNETIETLENYAKKYLNYTLYNYKINEIDVEDMKKLDKNIQSIKEKEIFGDEIYNHGFYFKSSTNSNNLIT